MDVQDFDMDGPILFKPTVFKDDRGYFMETFQEQIFEASISPKSTRFVQDNQSFSKYKGTVRGLHFQSPPHAQGKLVRCSQGAIIDIALDARVDSPTFGEHVSVELTAENAHQLWVPIGFLHGFSTLVDDTIVQYKCTDYYNSDCDRNIAWNDPDLNIDWKFDVKNVTVSTKDAVAQNWANFESPFTGLQ